MNYTEQWNKLHNVMELHNSMNYSIQWNYVFLNYSNNLIIQKISWCNYAVIHLLNYAIIKLYNYIVIQSCIYEIIQLCNYTLIK